MDKKGYKEILEKQLQLLVDESKKACGDDLINLTKTIISVIESLMMLNSEYSTEIRFCGESEVS